MRMRAVTRVPVNHAKIATRRKKNVSWGDLEVFEYDEDGAVEGIIDYDTTNVVIA
jgi:hypothetical protein